MTLRKKGSAEEGVVQALLGDSGAALGGGRYSCRLRLVHLNGDDGRQQGLLLESPPFVLLVPEGDGDAARSTSLSVFVSAMRRQSASEQAVP